MLAGTSVSPSEETNGSGGFPLGKKLAQPKIHDVNEDVTDQYHQCRI